MARCPALPCPTPPLPQMESWHFFQKRISHSDPGEPEDSREPNGFLAFLLGEDVARPPALPCPAPSPNGFLAPPPRPALPRPAPSRDGFLAFLLGEDMARRPVLPCPAPPLPQMDAWHFFSERIWMARRPALPRPAPPLLQMDSWHFF